MMTRRRDSHQIWLACIGWVWLLIAARIGFLGALQAAIDLSEIIRSSGSPSFDPSRLGLLAPIALFMGNNYVVLGAVKGFWGVLGVCLAAAYLARVRWGQWALLRWAVVSTAAFAVAVGYQVVIGSLAQASFSTAGSVLPSFLLASGLSVAIGVVLIRLLGSSDQAIAV